MDTSFVYPIKTKMWNKLRVKICGRVKRVGCQQCMMGRIYGTDSF